MLVGFSALVALFLSRQTRADAAISYPIFVTTTVFMAFAIWEFLPGRIDHHNMQIIGLLMICVGLERWSRNGGILIGLDTLICIVIGVEGLPLIAMAFMGLVGCFVFRLPGSGDVLVAAACTILALTIPAGLVFLGPAGMVSTQCDAFPAPYIVLALGCSSVLLVGTLALSQRKPLIRAAGLAATGAAFIGSAGFMFPRCLSGPYWMIDPLTRRDWLDRVSQEQSFIYYFGHRQFTIVMLLMVLVCISIAALPVVARDARQGSTGLAIVFAIAALSLVLTLLQTRNIPLPSLSFHSFCPTH